MATFKLEGEDDAPEEQSGAPQGAAPKPGASASADEFSFFLEDDDKTKKPSSQAAPAQAPAANRAAATPIAPVAPAGPPTRVVAPLPTVPAQPGAPVQPGVTVPQQPAPPNLMRPAQSRADKSQPPGINVPAAIADSPILTQPDAASIAQSESPSDDLSSGLQSIANNFAKTLDAGEGLFTWVARLALPVAALSLAYILAAVLTGSANNLTTNPNAAQVVHFLTLAAQAFSYSVVVLAVALLLLSYDDNRLGAMVTGVALALGFGAPLLLRAMLGPTNYAASRMASVFFHAGHILLYIGLFKATIDLGGWAWNLPNKIKSRQSVAGAVGFGKTVESKQQRIARNANMFSPCWNLPFCREAIRVLCPAFLARKTCWKFGRGCYCDEEMVGRIVRNESIDQIKAATTRQSKEAPPCGRCYIFLEHQTHKFRMLSPLALPSTIALMFAAWPLYDTLFSHFTEGYIKLFSSLSFNVTAPDAIKATPEGKAATAAATLSPQDIAHYSTYILGALLGFFLLIYISKFIEWAIFKAKW
jgi:hypothetical protein